MITFAPWVSESLIHLSRFNKLICVKVVEMALNTYFQIGLGKVIPNADQVLNSASWASGRSMQWEGDGRDLELVRSDKDSEYSSNWTVRGLFVKYQRRGWTRRHHQRNETGVYPQSQPDQPSTWGKKTRGSKESSDKCSTMFFGDSTWTWSTEILAGFFWASENGHVANRRSSEQPHISHISKPERTTSFIRHALRRR